jgi:predicted DNA-binding mobile mystery protein A
MSAMDLAARVGVTTARVSQFERAEVAGSIPLSTLERAASALNCRVCYFLMPNEPLELMVQRQALKKAAALVAMGGTPTDPRGEDDAFRTEVISERIRELANDLVDRRGLWQGA